MGIDALDWYDVVARIGVAALLGGLIGLEREVEGHDAGFRTHLLLAVGAALFGAVSVGAFDSYVAVRADSNIQIDVTRIASYVAAGVGFIGGGAILKSFGIVRGITTAASLWTAAAVGLASGLGFWSGAIAATLAALIALALLQPVGSWFGRALNRRHSMLVQVRKGANLSSIIQELDESIGGSFKQIRIGEGEDADALEVAIELWAQPEATMAQTLLERLAARDDVISVRFNARNR